MTADTPDAAPSAPRWERLRPELRAAGQEHLLDHLDALSESDRARYLDELEHLDCPRMDRLWREASQPAVPQPGEVTPPRNLLRVAQTESDRQRRKEARVAGLDWLRAGKVAALLVAGGEGTRLGFPHPKGMFPIAPVSGRSLYQIFAEQLLALSRRTGVAIPYCLMTSQATAAATRGHFEQQRFFGLEPEQVCFFQQGTMPAVDCQTGRVLRSEPGRLALSPDGHGGVIDALSRSGTLAWLRARGIEQLYYHQVDNPLARVCDPEFLGLHRECDSEASTKVIPKLNATEKMGAVVEVGGRLQIIEYSDLSAAEASRLGPDGQLLYGSGNTAMHVFAVDLLERLSRAGGQLPFHRSLKVVPHLDDRGRLVHPERPNAIKFERFVFDALPLARNPLVVETTRDDEFCPLKNREGEFSPDHVRRAMSGLHRRWLEQAGTRVEPAAQVEISPLRALEPQDLQSDPQRPAEVRVDTFLAPLPT